MGQVAVLMYHRVLPDDASGSGVEPGMIVRASTFERHLEWTRRRFPIELLGRLAASPRPADDPPVVALTFDDGWRDNLTVAWPILERHGVRATIFVVESFSASGPTDGGEFLSPGEIRELSDRGIEFGAHTVSHPRLSRVSERRAEDEMRRSKEKVEEWTGRSCDLFAYPFGDHHEGSVETARRHFRASVIVGGGWWTASHDVARIPRIAMHEDMTFTRALFEARLAFAG